MVEPVGFGANPETAEDNAFQEPVAGNPAAVESRAREEFRGLVEALESRGIEVVIFAPDGAGRGDGATPPEGEAIPPDSVFPNNWFSTHPGGRWVLYPMRAPNRRRERSPAIVAWLRERYGEPVDWSAEEGRGRYLEGTGSLVVDEPARVVYACRSSRTDPALVTAWAERFGCRPIVFEARDRDGRPVYHTNVVLTLGTGYAIVCAEAIESADRDAVLQALSESGRELVEIGLEQLHAFCANALELESADGRRYLVISERAWRALAPEQRETLERFAEVVPVDLATIETHGGGSVRCMLAELY